MASETVRGKRIVVRFDGERCIHSRNCVLGNPTVFVPDADGAWIHPDAAAADAVEAIVRSCPSGALTYERVDDALADEGKPPANTVRVRENGPLAFHADATVAGRAQPPRTTLCRCGLSKNKPWCDNSHRDGAFAATGEPDAKQPGDLPARDGPLAIEPQRDGPLKVSGNLEIVSGTGRTIDRTTETWLCRCGHSKHKPFCDSSHRKVGFQADGA